jgi:septal ring factor EnvC (AmiA/AmiB activator)
MNVSAIEKQVQRLEAQRGQVAVDLHDARTKLEAAQSAYLDAPGKNSAVVSKAQADVAALESILSAVQVRLEDSRAQAEFSRTQAEHDSKIAALASLLNEGALSAKALVSSHHAAIEALATINREISVSTASLIETQNNFRAQVEKLIGRPPMRSLLPQHAERDRQQQQEYSAKLSELKRELESAGVNWGISLNVGGEGIGFNGVRPGVKIPEAGQWTVPLNYCLNANSGAQS